MYVRKEEITMQDKYRINEFDIEYINWGLKLLVEHLEKSVLNELFPMNTESDIIKIKKIIERLEK